ncbi:hypothetical protein So717_29320 [Roseobacter cerasinus]|uniref:Uncharacterized protein n=2 Tax=Roseobacter cerasinus TaxID=2602289 RepID=A0A640VT18_9RHOB|nr:hypothetical protein So717_29320 [Roseobacter cerasinus]
MSDDLFYFGTDHEVLGMLYTLHGAQFGGAVIRQHLKQTLPMAPMAYYGLKPDPQNWKSLVVELDQSCKQKGALDCISTGARQTFELIDAVASAANAAGIGASQHNTTLAVGGQPTNGGL